VFFFFFLSFTSSRVCYRQAINYRVHGNVHLKESIDCLKGKHTGQCCGMKQDEVKNERKVPSPSHTGVHSPSTPCRCLLHEFPQHPLLYATKCATEQSDLHSLKLTTRIIIVNISILNLLGQLPLSLPGLLSVLKFKPVLIHGEPHSLNAIVM